MAKRESYLKKHWKLITFFVMAGLVAQAVYYFRSQENVHYQTYIAERANLTQEVNVTGRVVAESTVDLGFEVSGKVDKVMVEVGDHVEAGQELVSLNNATLKAQLNQALGGVSSAQAQWQQLSAALETEQARLDELKVGTRPEEIQIAETALANAQIAYEDAERNLENVQQKSAADLEEDYSSTLTALPVAMFRAKQALITLTDIQFEHFLKSDVDSVRLENAKDQAVFTLLGGSGQERIAVEALSELSGGVFGEVQALASPLQTDLDRLLQEAIVALNSVKSALDSISIKTTFSSTEQTNLETEKANINTEISTLTALKQAIQVQKVTNQNAEVTAEASLNTAQNNLSAARDELSLKQAGSTPEQIRAQEARVRQAQANLSSQGAKISQARANVDNYRAQIEKTILAAPIAGLVTRMEAKVGEIVLPTSQLAEDKTLITLISEGNYEIESNVPEVDIAKINLNDISRVTLDAYGNNVEFEAEVIMIDPAETVVEGVSTYKVTLKFTEADERIKSGMTANLDILTDQSDGVIAIPQRAVRVQNGSRQVRLLHVSEDGQSVTEEVIEVITGLIGIDGLIEIITGVEEGDEVILSSESN